MWFFMISCYILSAVTALMLAAAFFQNIWGFSVFAAGELTFIILTSIVYLFTETLVIFFFVGTGVSIKEYTQMHKLKNDYHRRSIVIKRKVYPPQLLNILLMMVLFISLGAVDTDRLPVWIYRVYFLACFFHFLYAKKIQHESFRENTENILAMAGIERPAPGLNV